MPLFQEIGPLTMDDKIFSRSQDIINDDENNWKFKNIQVFESSHIEIEEGKYLVNVWNSSIVFITSDET